MNFIIWIIAALIGILIGWLLNSMIGNNNFASAKAKAEQLIKDANDDAESLKKEKLIEADEEIYDQRQKLEEEFRSRKETLIKDENELTTRENDLERKADLISKKEQELVIQKRDISNRENQLKFKQEKLDRMLDEENVRLEKISGLTRDQAKKILMDNLIDDAKRDAAQQIYKIVDDAQKEAEKKARNILISAMQQTATDHAIESTVSVVTLPTDDMKGRIIGREGRNIRAFEVVTGIDVIVDDTPEAVILSGYDPYRREVARITMEKLITDGRIHPGRIEETYEKTVEDISEYLTELGEQALLETGVHGIHLDLVNMLGKLRYRTSYGQNVLQHSKEVSIIASIMAAELGLDEATAARAGILHDIGRAVDRHNEGSHTQIGYDIAKKYGENAIVLNAILGHHGEVEPISPITILVQIANEISSSRPGARREVIENFVQRMHSMEDIALSFDGVKASYAIQAGKEVRVIIDHDKIDDSTSYQLANDISKRIQSEVDYPGQVKVVVIREFRSIDLA
ncbi:MAG: ribonuclease Y [Caldithrix sp.]|nr:ribonuclease Y [Caldithrix sp.]